MKFLLDTGASSSFINPEYVSPKEQIQCDPVTITTVFKSYQIDKQVDLPIFPEFNQTGSLKFLIFRFHNFFDGLLGMDALLLLKAKIDLANRTLITGNAVNNISFKTNQSTEIKEIQAKSKTLIKLPINEQNGTVYINPIELAPKLFVSSGLYNVENGYSSIEITNLSDGDQIFMLDAPLVARRYDETDFIELNNFNLAISNDGEDELDHPSGPHLNDLLRTSHLNSEERKKLLKVCTEYSDLIYREGEPLSFTSKIRHKIVTSDDIPIYTKSYRYPYVHKQEIQTQINKMLEQGIIQHSYSPWSSPIWIVPKKIDIHGNRKWRLVIDYRKVNDKTISDRYPIPNINEILDKLGRCMYFTTLDLASGFHQIEMDPRHIQKTAFTVENGHYEFTRMPFGLKNAPSTFQRVMDNILKDLIGKVCLVYLDDIIIYSTSLQEHLEGITQVFRRLREANFKIQMDKCEFLRKEISFLGHIINSEGIKPNPAKIDAIKNFPLPKTRTEIKAFLGLVGYYRKFIKDLAKLTKPLTQCLKKGATIQIDQKYSEAFETCKNLLMNDPILQHPDFTKPFILTTDASNIALGAVLSQGNIGRDKPICFASRTLSQSECNYSTIERELLAIVWAVKYFRPYLFGRKFKIFTDHRPLTWVMNLKEPNSKLIRWRLKLEEYDYEIVYKKGKLNTNADALSRVKINEPLEENRQELFNNTSTIHSADENLNDGIPISERPLNEFNLQVIFERDRTGSPMTIENIFRNRQRRILRREQFNEGIMLDIFKEYFPPNKQTAIYTNDEIFAIVQLTYSKYFSQAKTFRLIRCTEILEDIMTEEKQEEIIRDYHERSNHRGINETLSHLKRKYYFLNMKDKITKTLNHCEKCKTFKYDRNPPKLKFLVPETPLKPLEILHIDLYSINNNQILTVIDKCSKFACGYALSCRNSITVLKAFKNFISSFGIPKMVVCDQGSEFVANIFKDFCRQFQIELHFTSFQQTSSNSPVERLHSTLTEIYRLILSKRKEKGFSTEHEEILSETLITYNNAIHSTTKHTPYELFFGRPYKFMKTLNFSNEHDYLTKLNTFLDELYPEIQKHVRDTTKTRIENLNDSREDPEDVTDGQIVFRKESRRNKLTPRYSKQTVEKDGKFTILTKGQKKLHKCRLRKQHKK